MDFFCPVGEELLAFFVKKDELDEKKYIEVD